MSARVPGFEYDIFISYRRNDNKYDSWVTEFVSNLGKELEATIKSSVSIYFDENPHDGLQETHNVDASLSTKIKSAILIPIISQTYCDPSSFAWQHEFKAFNSAVQQDGIGPTVRLSGGNVANRVLPIRIHELDPADTKLLEAELHGKLRPVDFVFKSPGVNRPLKPDDTRDENLNKTRYRDQINKVANAVRDILVAIQQPAGDAPLKQASASVHGEKSGWSRKSLVLIGGLLILFALAYGVSQFTGSNEESVVDKSIAVLPFDNLSGNPDREYFSDGIAEEIVIQLYKIKGIRVAAPTSSFQFKGKNVDIHEVGEKLRVGTVLTGSVQMQGERVKITAHFMDAKAGTLIWTEKFEGNLDNLFAIQERIATAIIQKTLQTSQSVRFSETLPENKEAYDAILKGRYFWSRRELKNSEGFFKKAISIDSSIAVAYAGLANTYVLFPLYDMGPPSEAMPRAKEMAERALQLDSTNTAAMLALAFMNTVYAWNGPEAKSKYLRVLNDDPQVPNAHSWYAGYLRSYENDTINSIRESQKSVDLDPLSMGSYTSLGLSYLGAGRISQAIDAFKRSVELNNRNPNALFYLAYSYLANSQWEEGELIINNSTGQFNARAKALSVFLHVKRGKLDQARRTFLELVEVSKTNYVSPGSLALAASYLNEKKLAQEYLLKAMHEHDPTIHFSFSLPHLPGDLFSDPENVALYKKLHAPGASGNEP